MSAPDVQALLKDTSFLKKVDGLVACYPEPRTALLGALHLCQSELRCVPPQFQAWVAERLEMTPAHVRGVVTFYEMYSEKPLGRHLLQVCRTLPCMLAGSELLMEHLQRKLGLKPGQTTQDGRFTLVAVECLACCDGGPALMINETLHRRVSPERADALLAELE
jgi:NADH-quinone oxidoreductase subunit E